MEIAQNKGLKEAGPEEDDMKRKKEKYTENE